jgi:propionyl-CoA carboxylase alpha chain
MFTKILIANRGEIACRVIATARKMGIQTVAVYSDADKDARHVKLADEAVRLGPQPRVLSAGRQDHRRLQADRRTGGAPRLRLPVGERGLCQALRRRGHCLHRPQAHSIAAMGDKIASKKLAGEAQVNTIPGYNDAIAGPEQAVEIAKGIGYPVMIKASAGGGGKGLRVAFNDKEAFEGFASCQNEARNSFGDDRIFIEKFVQEPRHIEIQILGDSHGNVVYLNERECSIQRRHQKVIEEAPSPFISDATRKAMGEQAVALAKAVKYQSAGTVEFVVGKDQDFYFLEMNTRLQVEHPVTECITGLDLVEQMIRVAAGEKLSFAQADVKRDGWAIECRINAEDPFRNFLPSTGRLVRFAPPEQTMWQSDTEHLNGVRVDTGVYDGGEIPMYYDSMIAKLIVHGKDRNDAIAKAREALNGFAIRGISSNIPFQAALLAHPDFVSGKFNTGFIAQHYADGFHAEDVPHDDPDFLVALALFRNRRYRARASTITGQMQGHQVQVGEKYTAVVLGAEGKNQYVTGEVTDFDAQARVCKVVIGEKAYEFRSNADIRDLVVRGVCNGKAFTCQIERGNGKNPLALRVIHNGTQADVLVLSPKGAEMHKLMPYKAPPDLSKFLLSPMPGLLVDVAVQPGQKVQAGEKLAVIEAMKMENILFAAQDGVVSKISAAKGDSLAVDDIILEFE